MSKVLPDFPLEAAAETVIRSYAAAVPVSALFTGCVVLQCAQYFTLTVKEPLLLRSLALVVTSANVLQLAFNTALLAIVGQQALVGPVALLLPEWPIVGEKACTVIAGLCVQYVFATIVFKMYDRSRIWAGIACSLILLIVIGGIGTTWSFAMISRHGLSNPPHLFAGIQLAFYVLWNGSSALFDILISTILCTKFWSSKRKSNFQATNNVLIYLLVTTMETFAMTAICALIATIMAILPMGLSGLPILRSNMGNAVVSMFLGPLYGASLLFTLNRRAPLRARLDTATGSSGPYKSPALELARATGGASDRDAIADGVRVHTNISTTDEVDPVHTPTFRIAGGGRGSRIIRDELLTPYASAGYPPDRKEPFGLENSV